MTIYSLDVLLSQLEPLCCSMSSSNCCFLTHIQISQETGQVVWYSYLFKNFPQSVVIHTVKVFSLVNETEVDVFLEYSLIFLWSNGCWQFDLWFLCFYKSNLHIWKFTVHILLKTGLENLEHYFVSVIGKDFDAWRDWGQEEKGMTEDEMARWHHCLDGRESEWTPGVGDGQGGLACCDSWGRKK